MKPTTSIIGRRCATSQEISDIARLIAQKFKPVKIILFGSYATGKPTPESDVDLLIITESHIPSWQLSAEISLAVEHRFPIDIIVRNRKQVSSRIAEGDFFLDDIICNGKILYEQTG